MKEQVQIQDETGTAKDIVRVIRQAEDNYQVDRLISHPLIEYHLHLFFSHSNRSMNIIKRCRMQHSKHFVDHYQ